VCVFMQAERRHVKRKARASMHDKSLGTCVVDAWHRLCACVVDAWHRLCACAVDAWHRLCACAVDAWHRLCACVHGADGGAAGGGPCSACTGVRA